MMLNAKLGKVFVVTREKLLVGTVNIEAIAPGEKMEKTLGTSEITRLRAPQSGYSIPLLHHALRVQHPEWVEPNGNSPTRDS